MCTKYNLNFMGLNDNYIVICEDSSNTKWNPEAEQETKPTYQELEAELKRLYAILGQAQSKKLDL